MLEIWSSHGNYRAWVCSAISGNWSVIIKRYHIPWMQLAENLDVQHLQHSHKAVGGQMQGLSRWWGRSWEIMWFTLGLLRGTDLTHVLLPLFSFCCTLLYYKAAANWGKILVQVHVTPPRTLKRMWYFQNHIKITIKYKQWVATTKISMMIVWRHDD